MERIMIIGCPGSGKTTLAKELSEILHIQVTHLDRLNWQGEWETVSAEEFDRRLEKAVRKQRWIIDGNYNRTVPVRLKRADTVIYLDFNRLQCLFGVIKRIIKYHGVSRPDMGGNCPEKFDMEFFGFIWKFNKDNRSNYYDMLSKVKGKRVIILRNRIQVRKFIKNMYIENAAD